MMKCVMLFVLVVIPFGTITAQSERTVAITGRAIDSHSRPIDNVCATISYAPCRGCTNDVLPSNESLGEGIFYVETPVSSNRNLSLFLEEVAPKGFWSPLPGAPFDGLNHLSEFTPVWKGRPNNRSRIDLGNVVVRVRYGKVVLEIPSAWRNFATTKLTSFSIRLLDRTGHGIYSGELPTEFIDNQQGLVKLALTKGRWQLQLSVKTETQELSTPLKSISINTSLCQRIDLNGAGQAKLCSQ